MQLYIISHNIHYARFNMPQFDSGTWREDVPLGDGWLPMKLTLTIQQNELGGSTVKLSLDGAAVEALSRLGDRVSCTP